MRPQAVPPREITLRFGDGSYLFALPAAQLGQLQTKRGVTVTYPDGGVATRPKPFGQIWREHTMAEYDPLDSREIVLQALIGGAHGETDDGREIKVLAVKAADLVMTYFDPLPAEEQWKFATSILIAVAQGFTPPDDNAGDGEGDDQGNVEGAGTADMSTSPVSSETASPVD